MQFKTMRYLILFMALMTNISMFAQSEVCTLDSQYLALVQQKKYGEAEALFLILITILWVTLNTTLNYTLIAL